MKKEKDIRIFWSKITNNREKKYCFKIRGKAAVLFAEPLGGIGDHTILSSLTENDW